MRVEAALLPLIVCHCVVADDAVTGAFMRAPKQPVPRSSWRSKIRITAGVFIAAAIQRAICGISAPTTLGLSPRPAPSRNEIRGLDRAAQTARKLNPDICPRPRPPSRLRVVANGLSFPEVGLHQCPSEKKGEGVPVRSLHVPSHVPSHPQTAAKVRGFSPTTSRFTAETDWLLEERRFEPSVPMLG